MPARWVAAWDPFQINRGRALVDVDFWTAEQWAKHRGRGGFGPRLYLSPLSLGLNVLTLRGPLTHNTSSVPYVYTPPWFAQLWPVLPRAALLDWLVTSPEVPPQARAVLLETDPEGK